MSEYWKEINISETLLILIEFNFFSILSDILGSIDISGRITRLQFHRLFFFFASKK